eukprot:TRINITY_DN75269_c0_g1_i1.p1 TRINITY_DN75269_c0_g1~~TRINITY_DN75269_c0_g1_i1.p1  ORF type:complete len:201 (+),score=63.47 TRINITY_DN75269_c0_g1_i1:117-719(+)
MSSLLAWAGLDDLSFLWDLENLLLLASLLVSGCIYLWGGGPSEDDSDTDEEPTVIAPPPPPPEKRRFELEELLDYRGYNGSEVLMACKGVVYHVDPMHYGPKGGYHVFAGKDVSRHLGKMDVGDKEANQTWLSLVEKETAILDDWESKFKKKYNIWGWLTDPFVDPPVDPAALDEIPLPGSGGDPIVSLKPQGAVAAAES